MIYRLYETNESLDSAYSLGSTAIDIGSIGGDSFSVQVIADVATPSAVVVPSADIDATDNEFTKTAHGLTTGLKGQFTTSGALPTGISAVTDYFIIYVSADVFKVATTLNNALAGTAVDLGDAGTGDQTFTPTALAGGSIKLQQSNDNTNWSDLGSATNITVDATIYLEKDRPTSRYVRSYLTLTAGYIACDLLILVKGDRAG